MDDISAVHFRVLLIIFTKPMGHKNMPHYHHIEIKIYV